jgi:hypothetical protein
MLGGLDSVYIFIAMIVLVCTCVTAREIVLHFLPHTLSYHFIQRSAISQSVAAGSSTEKSDFKSL